jgi:glyoxylase-like metal-dependent hydrolase (beta-lactamase superfamily II)
MSTQTEPFIDSRKLGDATITVISDGGLHWAPKFPVPEVEWRQAIPEADEQGRVWLGLNVVVVRLGDALVIIDPGMDDPDSKWQRDRPRVWPDMPVRRTAGMAAGLTQLGIAPEDVTHVVITHPHSDHFAGVAREWQGGTGNRFPNARHFIGRKDWDANVGVSGPGSDFFRLMLIELLGNMEFVDDELEIAPGITVLAAPGETPGHCIVRVESNGEVLYNLGDVIHHPCEVAHPDWAPPGRDLKVLTATRQRCYAAAARENALVVNAHDQFPPWSRIVANGDGYQWQSA